MNDGERESGYSFVHFEENEEGVAAVFKAVSSISSVGMIM